MTSKLSNAQIAWRVAQDIFDGAYVNLGIGFPEMVAKFQPPGRQAVFHTLMAGVGLTVRATPRLIREFPFNALLADVDRRIRRGIPLV